MSSRHWKYFWFDFSFPLTRLTTWRSVFYAIFAFDLWLLFVEGASMYEAGEFIPPHLAWLEPVRPKLDVAGATAGYLVAGYLSLTLAVGAAGRRSAIALCVIFSTIYFSSQIDSFQHHYLLCWLLLLNCFLPASAWGTDSSRRPAEGENSSGRRVHSWAFQLIYVQLGIIYFWAAVTKTSAAWLNGSGVRWILTSRELLAPIEEFMETLGFHPALALVALASVAMVGEYLTALIYWIPSLRFAGFLLVPVFHSGIELMGLNIGLFTYYMVAASSVLLAPEPVVGWVRGKLEPGIARARRWGQSLGGDAIGGPVWIAGTAAACGGLALCVPFANAGTVAASVVVFTILGLGPAARRRDCALHLLCAAALVATTR